MSKTKEEIKSEEAKKEVAEANLATAKAELVTAEEKLATAEEKLATAKAELEAAKTSGDEDKIKAARSAFARAEQGANTAQEGVNTAQLLLTACTKSLAQLQTSFSSAAASVASLSSPPPTAPSFPSSLCGLSQSDFLSVDSICRVCRFPASAHITNPVCARLPKNVAGNHRLDEKKEDGSEWGGTICKDCGVTAWNHVPQSKRTPGSGSGVKRRQANFRDKLNERAKKNDTQGKCEICQRKTAEDPTAVHVIPHCFREGLTEQGFTNPGFPDSPSDTRNGLLLCSICDDAFENNRIFIHPDGTIKCAEEWISQLSSDDAKFYCRLHGSQVPWASSIGVEVKRYPTAAMLKWRLTLPPPSTSEARNLIKEFNAAAKQAGRVHAGEEEDDEEETRSKRHQTVGAGSYNSWKCDLCGTVNTSGPRCAGQIERNAGAGSKEHEPCPGKRSQ